MLAAGGPARAASAAPPALKAAFLYNFAKFVEWPQGEAAPLRLCVLGDQAARDALMALVTGASIDGRAVIVDRSAGRQRLRDCHMLYVGSADAHVQEPVLSDLRTLPILTVGDGAAFARLGGIVGLVVEGNKMRFAINQDAAQRAGVRLSSKLLTLATLIDD
jgi:hypothetical protein